MIDVSNYKIFWIWNKNGEVNASKSIYIKGQMW